MNNKYFFLGVYYFYHRKGGLLCSIKDQRLRCNRRPSRSGPAVSLQFNSNGILLDESRQSDLIAAGLDELRISLDAASPQGYKAMRTDPADRSSWRKCFRPKTLMYITANGNVLPCCISPFATSDYSSIVLGNVFESGLQEIWLGSGYQKFRKTHQTNTPPKCCRGCGIRWSL